MIVLLVSLRDERQFIDAHIRHHLKIGVDRYVITEVCSKDGSREILKKYEKDERFHITYLDDQDFHKYNAFKVMVDIAKEKFAATWLTFMDIDEFILPMSGSLKEDLKKIPTPGCNIRRYNVAFQKDIPFSRHFRFRGLKRSYAVVDTNPDTPENLKNGEEGRWILGPILPKVFVDGKHVDSFTRGGHGSVEKGGKITLKHTAKNIISLHYPFTTYKRFLNKVNNITEFENMMRLYNKDHPGTGWHWYRLVRILEKGESFLRDEYELQLIRGRELKAKVQDGTILPAKEIFEYLNVIE